MHLFHKLKKSLSLRLTLWYVSVSLASYVAIFAIAYYSIATSLQKEDKMEITLKGQKYKEAYGSEELSGLQDIIDAQRGEDRPFNYIIRVADKGNNTLLLQLPDDWRGQPKFDTTTLRLNPEVLQIHIPQSIYEVYTFLLADDVFIQIGKSIDYRVALLERFRGIFISISLSAIIIGFVAGYLLTFRSLSPIRQLTKTVASIINTAEIGTPVPSLKSADELSDLVNLFNRMLERIEALINAMNDSLDMVAHDLRTPMMRIRGIAESALLSNPDNETYKEALSDCLEESDRLLKMLNTLMDISEAKAGTLNLQRERINIAQIVQETVEVYRYVAEQKDVAIRIEARDAVTMADPNRMRQVVGNLLDNAIKYTPTGGSVDVRVFKKGETEIVIEVSDTGIGIGGKDLPKIWDRLYRSPKSQTERGMGMGLSLVKSIVELHKGRVDVVSELGRGSTFTIYLQ